MIGTICQPIVDYIYAVDDDLLTQLNGTGRTNGYMELKDDILEPMLKTKSFRRKCGGTSLNTISLLARKTDIPLKLIGCVGNDSNGQYLRDCLASSNINYSLEVANNHTTAKCNVFLSNFQDRFLITNLGAADHLTDQYIEKHLKSLLKSKIIYLSMFIVLKIPKIQKMIAEEITNQILVINLSDANVIKKDKAITKLCFTKAHYVVGNRDEVESLYSIIFEEEQNTEFSPESFLAFKSKKIVVTNGDQPTYYLYNEMIESSECSVINILPPVTGSLNEPTPIDTNGAGDSFAAGLVYGIYNDYSLKDSILVGHQWAREYIISNSKNMAEFMSSDSDGTEDDYSC